MRFRIAPAPQQGGTQTIQQTINLSHNNACGFNPFLELLMGDTGISYMQFGEFLNTLFREESTVQMFEEYVQVVRAYNDMPSETLQRKMVMSLYEYGLSIKNALSVLPPIAGYRYVCSVYDSNGATILDTSLASSWPPVIQTGADTYESTTLVLQTYRNPENTVCTIYPLLTQPSVYSWIDQSVGTQSELINSSYLVNQISMSESVIAVSTILTDTANTRVYKLPGFGFSARPYSPKQPDISYNVCFMKRVADGAKLLSSFFVRLTLLRQNS